jgi:glutaconate CoA-transferase subunit A
MERQHKVGTLTDAVAMIRDGATLAVGGRANRRVPMALVREIARQGRRSLRIVRLDRDMNLDAWIKGDCHIVEGDEHVLRARLGAAAAGLAFMPLDPSADWSSDRAVEAVDDPFTGKAVRIAAALRPDVAILHAHTADRHGNVALDADCDPTPMFDATMARASKRVIVSVEQIVSDETIRRSAPRLLLRADQVACVIEAPYGAHPSACDARYDHDPKEFETDAIDHDVYLQHVGARRLFSLTRQLSTRL